MGNKLSILSIGPVLSLGLLCLSACVRLESTSENNIIAKVNGQPVYFAEVSLHLKQLRGQLNPELDKSLNERVKLRALNEAIIGTLIRMEANKRNIQPAKEETEGRLANWKESYPPGGFEEMLRKTGTSEAFLRRKISDQIVIEKLTNELFASETLVSDDEISSFYEKNKSSLERRERVHALQIMVPTKEESEKIHEEISTGKISFESAARKYSLSPDAAKGGDLGFFGMDEKIPTFNKVFSMKVGDISKPIQSQYGYHLLKLTERQAKKKLSLKEARIDISKRLKREKEMRIYKEWVSKLLKEGKILRNESLFAKLD